MMQECWKNHHFQNFLVGKVLPDLRFSLGDYGHIPEINNKQ